MSVERTTALVLALLACAIYNSNLRLVGSGDSYPARYLPFALLKDRALTLEPVRDSVTQGNPRPYWLKSRPGPAISTFPVAVPVLLTPLYLPAYAVLSLRGWTFARLERLARIMEKLAASCVAAFSVALMFLLLSRRVRRGWAIALTLAYAFGTNTWMISSQALWQHGVSELCLVACLLVVTGPASARASFAAGLLCGLAVAARPTDVILAAALALHMGRWAKGTRWAAVAGVTLPALALVAYNLGVVGNIAGGYGARRGFAANFDHFQFDFVPGLAGLLFSPARGLFVYSPFLLLVPLALPGLIRRGQAAALDLILVGAVVVQLAFFAKLDWRGGCSWGPRWLTDALPFLMWVIAPAAQELRGARRGVFALAVIASVGAQAIGAYWYTSDHDEELLRGDPGRAAAMWSPRESPLVWELGHAPAPRDLLAEVDGAIDAVSHGGRVVTSVIAGELISAAGWCLVDGRTPRRVRVSLAPCADTPWWRYPGRSATEATAFTDRPDVRAAKGTSGNSGWQAELSTRQLAPGRYWLCLAASGEVRGELRQVTHREFEILDPAVEAAARLASHQDPAGWWRTAYTGDATFVGAHLERNTFLVAMIADLLAPVARDCGLEEVRERARRYLADQVEADGLVRYHGRPESVDPTLGCLISPDADDTALAWRVADVPAGPRLSSALATLEAYRTPQGLYRTWLAPRSSYVGIDPGRDPNPPDVAIQMHVLQFLDRHDRRAATALHRSLSIAVADRALWVYYARAPLVPLLRAAELARQGYPLPIAPAPRESVVESQRIWERACALLAERLAGRPGDPAQARELLATLAADGFARLREEPPLIYHNDLSARVRRYYWSEDFGYVLWLRLNACYSGS